MRDADISLHVAGAIYTGWQRVRVTRSIAQLAGTFDLQLTDRWALEQTGLRLSPGQAVRVAIGGHTVLTGRLDDVDASISARSHTLRVRGRDAAGDLVDCAVMQRSQEIADRDLAQITAAVCAPFGIAVAAEVAIGGPFATTHFQVGETVFELLDRLARMRGVLCVSDGQGGLRLTRAGDRRAGTVLQQGVNILSGESRRSQRDRYALYRVLGQQRGTDTIDAAAAAQAVAEVSDPAIDRYRPVIIQAEDQASSAECAERGEWERSVRAGRAHTCTVTVRGWFDGDAPWQPNTLIAAEARALGLSGDHLISEVTYRTGDSGRVTELTLTPPKAFAPLPGTRANPAQGSALFEGAA